MERWLFRRVSFISFSKSVHHLRIKKKVIDLERGGWGLSQG